MPERWLKRHMPANVQLVGLATLRSRSSDATAKWRHPDSTRLRTVGNSGRNASGSPAYYNVDFSVSKNMDGTGAV